MWANICSSRCAAEFVHQGLEGDVKFSGSTPELDDFTIRIVDGMLSWILCVVNSKLF
jgi:hypothetical protein